MGTAVLMLINLVRVVTLYYVGVWWPRVFNVVHVDVRQAVFIFLAISLWVLWARWATLNRSEPSHAAA